MAMMASGPSGNPNLFDDDNAVLDDDFLNDGTVDRKVMAGGITDLEQTSNLTSLLPRIVHP